MRQGGYPCAGGAPRSKTRATAGFYDGDQGRGRARSATFFVYAVLMPEEVVIKADALMRFLLSGNRSLEEFVVLLARISLGVSSLSG